MNSRMPRIFFGAMSDAMKPELVSTSKFLSLVLRHQLETIGLEMDENGWVEVEHLLTQLAAAGKRIGRAELEEVVATNDKRRFAFSEDGRFIRASQGHSIEIDLALEPVSPPAVLYHGTAERNVASILSGGLHSAQRRHVHLSADTATATRVGSRHGKPVVFQVDARAMAAAGYTFYCSENGVWLTERVPAEYLTALH